MRRRTAGLSLISVRELQRRLDIEFVNLVAECVDHETQQLQLGCFRELIEQRKKYDSYIEAFCMKQHEEFRQQTSFHLPYRLAEYNDTIARLVLDTVKVLSKERLLVIFKGGSVVEQTIEY